MVRFNGLGKWAASATRSSPKRSVTGGRPIETQPMGKPSCDYRQYYIIAQRARETHKPIVSPENNQRCSALSDALRGCERWLLSCCAAWCDVNTN